MNDDEPIDISPTLERIARLKEEARREAHAELGIKEGTDMPLEIRQPKEPRCPVCGKHLIDTEDGIECPDQDEHNSYVEDFEPISEEDKQ